MNKILTKFKTNLKHLLTNLLTSNMFLTVLSKTYTLSLLSSPLKTSQSLSQYSVENNS